MNLANDFWERIQDLLDMEKRDNSALLAVTKVRAPDASESDAARDLAALVKLCAKSRPPALLSQPHLSQRPICLVMTVSAADFPNFGELFEQYLDKNALVAEAMLRLKPHLDVPYLLVVSSPGFLLYCTDDEHVIRQGQKFEGLEEMLFAPISAGTSLDAQWNAITRKSTSQNAEEFGRWIDLWKAAIGSHSNTPPAVLQGLLQKVTLLFVYDTWFGFGDEELGLRSVFLGLASTMMSGDSSGDTAELFDGVAWIHEGSQLLAQHLNSDFVRWSAEENSFFAMMSSQTRRLFSQLVMEFFLLSSTKYSTQSQAETFGDANSRLKMWKHSVTDTTNIARELQADEINVYEPMRIDLDECGTTWALHLVRRMFDFWRDRCLNFEREMLERRNIKLQFDMFQKPDQLPAHVPSENDVFELTFRSSIRLSYSHPATRSTMEYLLLLLSIDYAREHELRAPQLSHVANVFRQKATMAVSTNR
jgi:hypothetical protein